MSMPICDRTSIAISTTIVMVKALRNSESRVRSRAVGTEP